MGLLTIAGMAGGAAYTDKRHSSLQSQTSTSHTMTRLMNDTTTAQEHVTQHVGYVSIPVGSNEQKSGKDLVRMPGTKWCGMGWRTDKLWSVKHDVSHSDALLLRR